MQDGVRRYDEDEGGVARESFRKDIANEEKSELQKGDYRTEIEKRQESGYEVMCRSGGKGVKRRGGGISYLKNSIYSWILEIDGRDEVRWVMKMRANESPKVGLKPSRKYVFKTQRTREGMWSH